MSVTQEKTSDVFRREPQPQPVGPQAEPARIRYLPLALQLVGVTFIFGIYTFTIVWPSGWSWHTGHHIPHYLQMILGVYATLGIFLLIASRKPLANLSLIWFTVWSSVVHAGIMAAQAFGEPGAHRTSMGRRPGATRYSGCACASHASNCGSRHSCEGRRPDCNCDHS